MVALEAATAAVKANHAQLSHEKKERRLMVGAADGNIGFEGIEADGLTSSAIIINLTVIKTVIKNENGKILLNRM